MSIRLCSFNETGLTHPSTRTGAIKPRQPVMSNVRRHHSMPDFTISESFKINKRGTAVSLVGDPIPSLSSGIYRGLVTAQNGSGFETTASVEFARKVPPGEVMMFLFPHNDQTELTEIG